MALDAGIAIVDSAINYRCQRSERVIGRVLTQRAGTHPRPDVWTKGGYVPLDGTPPDSKEQYRAYITRQYVDTGIIGARDLVAGGHCITPAFLRDQIARSRANLCVDKIDLYLIHNPEQQLDGVERDELERRLRTAFETLEKAVAAGDIGAYGCATWHGLRVPPTSAKHISLEWMLSLARDAGGERHAFTTIQLPINLAMPEAMREQTQSVRGRECSALDAAAELGVSVAAVAPLMQGRLTSLPPAAREAFPGAASDAACALAFVGMLPHVDTVVVGMRSADHVLENVATFAAEPA